MSTVIATASPRNSCVPRIAKAGSSTYYKCERVSGDIGSWDIADKTSWVHLKSSEDGPAQDNGPFRDP